MNQLKIDPKIETIKATCESCGCNFESEIIRMLGHKISPQRFCDKCFESESHKWEKEQVQLRLQNTKQDRIRVFESICPKNMRNTDPDHVKIDSKSYRDSAMHTFDDGKGLMLHGDNRTGKTRALWSIYKKLKVHQGAWCYPFKMGMLDARWLTEIKGNNYEKFFEWICDIEYLLLDDPIKSNMSPGYSSFFLSMLDCRCNSEKPTIMTMNKITSAVSDQIKNSEITTALFGRLAEFFHKIEFKTNLTVRVDRYVRNRTQG